MGGWRKPLSHKDLGKTRPAPFDVTPYGTTTYSTWAQQTPCQMRKNLALANTVPNYSANNYFRLAWNYIRENQKIMLDD